MRNRKLHGLPVLIVTCGSYKTDPSAVRVRDMPGVLGVSRGGRTHLSLVNVTIILLSLYTPPCDPRGRPSGFLLPLASHWP